MKRFSAILLFALYFSFSTGVVISMHFCMNRFDSVKLGATASEICDKCGMHTADFKDCCHDEVQIFKIQDDHQAGAYYQVKLVPLAVRLPDLPLIPDLVAANGRIQVADIHSPPARQQATYLRNCVFRI